MKRCGPTTPAARGTATAGGRLCQDAETDEIIFPEQVASLPIAGADTYLNKLLRQYADQALARQPSHRNSVRAHVERVIPPLLPHGKANTSEVARQLGLSRRTLSRSHGRGRNLFRNTGGAEGCSGQALLRDRELPVSEITWLLGYREGGSFTHAFKRWTGMSPSQFRSSHRLRDERAGSFPPSKGAR